MSLYNTESWLCLLVVFVANYGCEGLTVFNYIDTESLEFFLHYVWYILKKKDGSWNEKKLRKAKENRINGNFSNIVNLVKSEKKIILGNCKWNTDGVKLR